jgi:hypothetical protein
MSNIGNVIKRLLSEGNYALDVQHIEQGKNAHRKIFASDVIHILFSVNTKHYEGDALDKKLVIFSEGIDVNGRMLRVVSRLIDFDGQMIVSVTYVELARTLYVKTSYELEGEL